MINIKISNFAAPGHDGLKVRMQLRTIVSAALPELFRIDADHETGKHQLRTTSLVFLGDPEDLSFGFHDGPCPAVIEIEAHGVGGVAFAEQAIQERFETLVQELKVLLPRSDAVNGRLLVYRTDGIWTHTHCCDKA